MLNRLSVLLMAMGVFSALYAGDPGERRHNHHSANQIRTTFFNYALLGRVNPTLHYGLEWPINSGHSYVGDMEFMFGAEVHLPGGILFHSVEVGDSPRGNNEVDPNNPAVLWGWEPLAGYANPASQFVAMNHQPDTWPAGWNGWLGIPGYSGRADQEGFYVIDDNSDEEFFLQYGFRPDSLNPTRKGMGWSTHVRSFQFNHFLLQNSLIFRYTLFNEGTTYYPNTFFATLVGTTIGGDGDSNDDLASFDISRNLVYSWDADNSGNTGWSPVGYMGVALLESPGIPFDGIDNDGDGASGEGNPIDAQILAPVVLNPGDPIVLIDYNTYQRSISSMPANGITIVFNGRQFHIAPGDTLREELNGIDDNLNGLIDELTEIPGNALDDNNNGIVDEYNPHWGKKYIDYFSGNGMQNALIDESKFDFLDNDHDWDPATDDVGLDGIPNTNDSGEGDGLPTSGVGTNFPGEPHIDKTDPDEADQVGLTSFFYFTPFNLVQLRNDEQLWTVSTPGYFQNIVSAGLDGDIIFGSGFFPSVAGDSQQVVIGLVMGESLANLRANADLLQNFYNENFRIGEFNFHANFPAPGEVISGNHLLNIDVDNGNPTALIDILVSDDFGREYDTLALRLPNPAGYNWQTTGHHDGVFYKLKAIARIDSFQTFLFSDSVFTIDNPGNGAPQVIFQEPIPGGNVSGVVNIFWAGGDPENSPVEVRLAFSNNSGVDWQPVADNLPASGSFAWDTYQVPNTFPPNVALLRLRITDGVDSSETVLPGHFFVSNPVTQLSDSLIIHRRGSSDGEVTVFKYDSLNTSDHLYRLTFTENATDKLYHIFDVTDSVYVLSNIPLTQSFSPTFDGLFLHLADIAEVDVNQNETGWNNSQINVAFRASLFQGGIVQGNRYPADYDLIYSDQIIDTSWGGVIPGLPDPLPTPVNFTILNTTESRSSDFALWSFSNYDIMGILERDSGNSLWLTWEIRFDYPDSNAVLPALGDTFHLEIAEPFTPNDVYLFSRVPVVVGIARNEQHLPQAFQLYQNYPNPFNPVTTLRFEIPAFTYVKLEIYDLLGRKVQRLVNEKLQPGRYEILWNGRDNSGNQVASGIYFYRITAGNFVKTRKMILMR